MINLEYDQRNQEFNFYLQEIGYESHQFWKEKMKELLNHYPEYANNFAYIYYKQPEEMPLLEEGQEVKEIQEVKTEEKHEDFDELMKKYEDLSIDYGHLVDDFEVLEDQRNTLEKNYKITLKNFDVQKNKMEKEKQELENDKKILEQENQNLKQDFDNLRGELDYFIKQRDELIFSNTTLLKKVKNLEEENKNINNSFKESKDITKKTKKDYETILKQSKIDLKTIAKLKKELAENKYCNDLIVSNKNKSIEDKNKFIEEKEKYMEKIKKRLEIEFIQNRTLTNKFNYVRDFIKKLLFNLDHYKLRLEAEGVDTSMVQLIQEVMEMKNNNSLQISPLYDFCGNTVYIFHDKSMFEDKKNIRIPTENILLSTKGFIYIYNALVEGLVPIFTENGMIIHIPHVKELFSIENAKDHI